MVASRNYDEIIKYLEMNVNYDMTSLQMATTFEEAVAIMQSDAITDMNRGINTGGILSYTESGKGRIHLEEYWDKFEGDRREQAIELFNIREIVPQIESETEQRNRVRLLRKEGFSTKAIKTILGTIK